MKFLFLAGRETSYPRNDVLIRALQRLGDVDVFGWRERGSILLRSLALTLRSILSLRSREYDLVFVGFYGQLLMLPSSLWCSVPVIFDAFISTYDTLCFDRRLFSPRSLMGRMAYWLDKRACENSNQVLLDTSQHVKYFCRVYDLPQALLSALPVSCNEELFYPRGDTQISKNRVLFYSTYMPLHGVDTILKTAARLDHKADLEFRLLGDGPDLRYAKQLAKELDLKNVHFLPYVPLKSLAEEIASANLCLGGHFGGTGKADRVVPSKVYQLMAMAKTIIAGDTSANRDLLTHGESAFLCPPTDPASLAEALQLLQEDSSLRGKLGKMARQRFEQVCNEDVVTQQLEEVIHKVLNKDIVE